MDALGLTGAQEITRELWVQEAMAAAAMKGERRASSVPASSNTRRRLPW